ncbi:hypothetical protein PMIN01_12299 [Paraphaeosphaeria minitans]|uniref:Uncharacterized protein n=1 Tax=Paraphaeosphaeria minitans TaxID=565426 RepID=A0A9P6G6N9_9PLEO|nr:hypothetical protein PMIN01_12299 [Paraphaeosphaeria minitans]
MWKEWGTGEAARPGVLQCNAAAASEETGHGKSVKLHTHLLPRVSSQSPHSRTDGPGGAGRDGRAATFDTLLKRWPGMSRTGHRGKEKCYGAAAMCCRICPVIDALGSRECRE